MKPAASLGGQAQQMNEGIEKGWRLSYTVRPEEIRSVAMPEPQHRIGPAGVSSGVSLRELPKARLEDMTKICQHYEQKCSGIYSSDSAAARYLFQLSREVQQVALTLTQEKSDRTLAAEKAEKCFEEWQEFFGPDAPLIRDASSIEIPLPCDGVSSAGEAENSKGEEGKDGRPAELKGRSVPDGGKGKGISPAKIAEALRSLAQRAANAEKEIAEVKNERVCSEAGLREVLDAHVTASAESSEADRLMHQEDRAAMVDKHKKAVETLREQHEQAIQQILVEKDVEHNKSCEAFKKQLNEVQLELLNNRQHTINTEGQWRKRVEDLEQRERAEASRMREHFQDQLSRVKNEAAAALGSSSVAEASRRTVPGARGVPGSSSGTPGRDVLSDGDAGNEEHKVRSLSLMLEESRKECKWVRERNQELERVVEALRKTIMRQAEISSQRPEHPGGRLPPTHAHRSPRHPPQDHAHHQPGGPGYSMGGLRGTRVPDHAFQEPGNMGLSSRGGGHYHSGGLSRDDDLLRHRQGPQGAHGSGGSGVNRGHEEAYMNRHHHPHQGFPSGSRGGVVQGGGGLRSGGSAAAAAGGMSRGGVGGRPHPHQMQQQHVEAAAPPPPPAFRRYASHEAFDDGRGILSSASGGHVRQQHTPSRQLVRGGPGGVTDRGGGGNVPVSAYDRELPDRGWSQSAPLPGNTNVSNRGHHGAAVGGRSASGAHGVIGSRSGGAGVQGGTEFAVPVPRHHRQHDGGHSATVFAKEVASASAGVVGGGGGASGGGGARWDRDPVRDTMAFASNKYPPGVFPSGGVYGEGAIFEQIPPLDKRSGSFKGSAPQRGAVGAAAGQRANGDFHMQQQQQQQRTYSRTQGMLPGSSPEGVSHGGRRSRDASPVVGPSNSPAQSSTGGTPVLAGVRQGGREGGDSGNYGKSGVSGIDDNGGIGNMESGGHSGDFDFGEIDTAAVLGL